MSQKKQVGMSSVRKKKDFVKTILVSLDVPSQLAPSALPECLLG